MIYLRLYYEFFKVGLFAVGGGLATIPFLNEMANKFGWFTSDELANMLAVSESTPGPIGINMATYIGYKLGGIPGGIIATLGEISPAIVIIILIAKALSSFKENKYVQSAFKGIRPCVFGLILSAFVSIFNSSVIFVNKFKETNDFNDLFDYKILFIFILILLLNKKWKIHPIFYVILSAIIGIVLGI